MIHKSRRDKRGKLRIDRRYGEMIRFMGSCIRALEGWWDWGRYKGIWDDDDDGMKYVCVGYDFFVAV